MRRADHSSRGVLPSLLCLGVVEESHRGVQIGLSINENKKCYRAVVFKLSGLRKQIPFVLYEERKTNRMQQLDVYYYFCLNMFRASLCPSSGEQRPCNRVFVLLKMGIMMPETCWDRSNNKHLIVSSFWFFSLHTLLTMHGHRNLKPKNSFCTEISKRNFYVLQLHFLCYSSSFLSIISAGFGYKFPIIFFFHDFT